MDYLSCIIVLSQSLSHSGLHYGIQLLNLLQKMDYLSCIIALSQSLSHSGLHYGIQLHNLYKTKAAKTNQTPAPAQNLDRNLAL